MRIGIDADPLVAPWGGIRRYTADLVRGLAQVDPDNEYVLFGRVPPGELPGLSPRFRRRGVHLPLQRWMQSLALPGAGELDLYHGTNYTAPLLGRTPLVLTIHDLTVHLFPETHPRMRRMAHRLLPTLCRRAAAIIADSYNTKADLVRHYRLPADKIEVVYLAAGDEFRPVVDDVELERVRRRYHLPERFVLFVGSVEARKNLPALVDTTAELLREGFEERLVIAGGGEKHYVKSLHDRSTERNLEIGRDVVFTGPIEDADLPALYSLCELFVYPSIYEGFGLPPMEAMACGAPVVLPDNSSFAEVYQDCAWMVNLHEPGSMTTAVKRLLRDPSLRDELTERGLKRAGSRSWEETAAETLRIYRRVASGD